MVAKPENQTMKPTYLIQVKGSDLWTTVDEVFVERLRLHHGPDRVLLEPNEENPNIIYVTIIP